MHFYYISNEFINYYNEFINGRPQWHTQDFSMGGGFQYCNDVKVLQWNSVNESTVNKSSRLLHPICLERNRPNPFPL